MKLFTALRGSATLLLLLPLAVVQATGPLPGIGREVNEAVQNLEGLHLTDTRFPSVNRSPGVIGDGRNRRSPATQAWRGFGGAGSFSEPVNYQPGAFPYGHGYEPDPAGSTSYFVVQPWASSQHNPTSSNAVQSRYQHSQTLVHPGPYSGEPSRSFRRGQNSYRAVPRRNKASSNAASRRHSPAASPAPHPSWSDANAAAHAFYDRFKDDIERLSAGSEEKPSPAYVAISHQAADHDPTDTVPPDTQLSDHMQHQVVNIATKIASKESESPVDTRVFYGHARKFLDGEALRPDNRKKFLRSLGAVRAEADVWAELVELLLGNGARHFGLEQARTVLMQLGEPERSAVYFSAMQVNLSYRVRLQMENRTWLMRESKMQWGPTLFSLTPEESLQVAALAWYFIKAGERDTSYKGMTQAEEEQLRVAVNSRQQRKEFELPPPEEV